MKNYESTLNWYAEHDPFDFEGIRKLIDEAQHGSGAAASLVTSTKDLLGKNVCLVIGHEPGGGARGERAWNIKVAKILAKSLEARGAKVLIYYHKTRDYENRCYEMRAGVRKHMPGADAVLLMHYNSVSNPKTTGHHFQYRGAKVFAECMRDAWQKHFPWSEADRSNGIYHNTNDPGSLMLKLAPSWACLTEPFFESSPYERKKLINDHAGAAKAYDEGIGNFLLAA